MANVLRRTGNHAMRTVLTGGRYPENREKIGQELIRQNEKSWETIPVPGISETECLQSSRKAHAFI